MNDETLKYIVIGTAATLAIFWLLKRNQGQTRSAIKPLSPNPFAPNSEPSFLNQDNGTWDDYSAGTFYLG